MNKAIAIGFTALVIATLVRAYFLMRTGVSRVAITNRRLEICSQGNAYSVLGACRVNDPGELHHDRGGYLRCVLTAGRPGP